MKIEFTKMHSQNKRVAVFVFYMVMTAFFIFMSLVIIAFSSAKQHADSAIDAKNWSTLDSLTDNFVTVHAGTTSQTKVKVTF